jgi:hypothetical protein
MPGQTGRAPAVAADPAPAPRLYIGTIEVRATAPAPVVATQPAVHVAPPRTDGGPLSRGYVWRFGLAQG